MTMAIIIMRIVQTQLDSTSTTTTTTTTTIPMTPTRRFDQTYRASCLRIGGQIISTQRISHPSTTMSTAVITFRSAHGIVVYPHQTMFSWSKLSQWICLVGRMTMQTHRRKVVTRHQIPSETQLRQDIPRGPGQPEAVHLQGVRQACAQQVAPFPDALLAGPQVLGLRRGVQPHRHAEDAREETAPHRHTAVLLRYTGQRVAPRHRAVPGPVAQAAARAQAVRPDRRDAGRMRSRALPKNSLHPPPFGHSPQVRHGPPTQNASRRRSCRCFRPRDAVLG